MTKVNELVEKPEQTWEIRKEMDVHPMLAPVSCKEKQIDRNAFAKVAMYGVPFTMISFDEWKRDVLDSVERRSSTIYFTANIDFIVQSLGDNELRRILCQADRVLCDGTPVRWLSGCFGERLVERLAGSDLVPEILKIADLNGYRVFLLGGEEEVNGRAIENIRHQYPGLGGIEGCAPAWAPVEQMPHTEINKQIQEFQPDILLVCLGCPKQEKWVWMNRHHWDVGAIFGLGACVDFIAGRRRRCPRCMRHTGLEWCHRLIQEPKRLGPRYVKDIFIMSRLLWNGWVYKKHFSRINLEVAGMCSIAINAKESEIVISTSRTMSMIDWQIMEILVMSIHDPRIRRVVVDCHLLHRMDNAGAGLLVEVWRIAARHGCGFQLRLVPNWLDKLMRDWGWSQLFSTPVHEIYGNIRGKVEESIDFGALYHLKLAYEKFIELESGMEKPVLDRGVDDEVVLMEETWHKM